MKIRLNKALASIASRRAAEKIIFDKRVTVNGKITELPQTMVEPSDTICVDNKPIKTAKRNVYYLLNKPTGLICTATEGKAKRVLDLFSHLPYRLFTAGRLDQETSGLILVTNDGEFANRVIHPSFNHLKEYLVKTSQEISDTHLKLISKGTIVQGTPVKPVSVKKVRRGTLKITVAEGKKHEVRHLVQAAGLTLLDLSRIRIGPLKLEKLAPGQWRELSDKEVAFFFPN